MAAPCASSAELDAEPEPEPEPEADPKLEVPRALLIACANAPRLVVSERWCNCDGKKGVLCV